MSGSSITELIIPPNALEHGGREVLRAFVVDGGLSVSLQRSFDDPSTWGIMLADIARHAARVFSRETDLSEAEALHTIYRMFDAERSRPTDPGSTSAIN